MIEQRARELVAALRSGDYKQGHNLLCRLFPDGTKTWCCLGVACDLGIKAGLSIDLSQSGEYAWADGGDESTYRKISFNGADGLLDDVTMAYFGFKTRSGESDRELEWGSDEDGTLRSSYSLAGANDGGATFTQIADFIEANWAKL